MQHSMPFEQVPDDSEPLRGTSSLPSSGSVPSRVWASAAAMALIERLRTQHGDILLYQSHGCCDGSTPMCLLTQELAMGAGDRQIATVAGVPYFVSQSQWVYLESVQVLLDVAPGALGTFSLEETQNLHFTVSQRLWSGEEWQALQAAVHPSQQR